MSEDYEIPLLLGRPFLATCRALIDVELGELILRFNKEKLVLNMFKAMKFQKENRQCYKINLMEEVVQEVTAAETPSPPKDPELKEFPKHFKYVFLGEKPLQPTIISNLLSTLEEEKLLRVLREIKKALGLSVTNLKCISPAY